MKPAAFDYVRAESRHQVLELLATYETVTVTFGASAFIFALFVAIRRFRM